MRLLEVSGDLFSSSECLAHCVSEDLEMGKGIAVHFRDKFGQVDVLKGQKKKSGEVAFIRDSSGRHIFYLITKKRYFEKPTYESLYSSLTELRDLCLKLNVTHISMPKIGCGLDKLEWDFVKFYLNNIFKDTSVTVAVYSL